MILHRIHARNLRTHADTEITFPTRGVVGLCGANESGKTTLATEATGWALFGTRATRGTVKGLRWHRAPARHVASVELEFSIGGKRYRVERSETDARLFEVGAAEPIAAGISAVDDYMPRLLGMSYEEWASSFLVLQKDLSRLKNMRPVERRQYFLRILGVGRIDEALLACRTRKNELARERAGLEAGLGERTPLEQEHAAAEEAAATAAAAHLDAQSEAGKAEAHASELDERRAAMDVTARRHDELERARGQAALYLRQAREELERVEAKIAEHPAADFDPAALEEAKAAVAASDARLAELEEAIEAERRAREQKIQDARVALSSLERQGKEIRADVETVEALGERAECPTCRQPIGERVHELLAEERAHLEGVREEYRAQERVLLEVSEPSDREMELRADLEKTQEERKRAADQTVELERNRQTAERVVELREEAARWSEKAAQATEREREALEALEALAFDPEVYETAVHDARAAAELAAKEREARARAEAELRGARARLERAEKALADYDRRAEALKALVQDHRTHERASERLAEFRAAVAGSIRPEMEALASGFVSLLTDGRHEGLVLTEDFDARLLESGVETEVVSGGTEDVTAIAMRLAVSQLISERAGHPLSLLILDEVFGSLDQTRRGNVLALLRRLSSVFSQIVLISHVEETTELVDQAILVTFDETAGRSFVEAIAGGLEAAA